VRVEQARRQGAHCTIASSPAAQTSTIFTPALHFLITSPSTPARATQAVTAMRQPQHAAPACLLARARTVGNISGGFVFGDHVRLRATPQSACGPEPAAGTQLQSSRRESRLTLLRSSSCSSSCSFSLSDILPCTPGSHRCAIAVSSANLGAWQGLEALSRGWPRKRTCSFLSLFPSALRALRLVGCAERSAQMTWSVDA
jgi:hypothetical protein